MGKTLKTPAVVTSPSSILVEHTKHNPKIKGSDPGALKL
jgi:hypothetical protein